MKIICLLTLFLFSLSCQLLTGVKRSVDRKVAGIFGKTSHKKSISKVFNLSKNSTWIVLPNKFEISSVSIHNTNVNCESENVVKVNHADEIIYYVVKESLIKCTMDKLTAVKIDYNYYESELTSLNKKQISILNNLIKSKDDGPDFLRKNLKDLGIYKMFSKKMKISELKKIEFKSGDLVDLKIWPQPNKAYCPDKSCEYDVNIYGTSVYNKNLNISGINQLKYPELKPFLTFCGSRFAASNIIFKADEGQTLEYNVDQNGFNCDINDFQMTRNKIDFDIKLTHISKNDIQEILLGKESELIKLKNKAIVKNINSHVQELTRLNHLNSKYIQTSGASKNKEGYFELWWEPFTSCGYNQKNCEDYEYILTGLKIVYEQGDEIFDIPFELSTFRSKVSSKTWPKAKVTKICSEELNNLIKQNFKLLDFSLPLSKPPSCMVKDFSLVSKKFDNRWLLVTTPKVVERNEVTTYIEGFETVLAPLKSKLESDPYQKGKIFFGVYEKTMGEEAIPFTRSRIIEVFN
jgi:hypothetical protein